MTEIGWCLLDPAVFLFLTTSIAVFWSIHRLRLPSLHRDKMSWMGTLSKNSLLDPVSNQIGQQNTLLGLGSELVLVTSGLWNISVHSFAKWTISFSRSSPDLPAWWDNLLWCPEKAQWARGHSLFFPSASPCGPGLIHKWKVPPLALDRDASEQSESLSRFQSKVDLQNAWQNPLKMNIH